MPVVRIAAPYITGGFVEYDEIDDPRKERLFRILKGWEPREDAVDFPSGDLTSAIDLTDATHLEVVGDNLKVPIIEFLEDDGDGIIRVELTNALRAVFVKHGIDYEKGIE